MAGMEQLEIHSKSYLVRWVNVKEGHSISWSIQPHKKSIKFGIFKHPGSAVAPLPKLPSSTIAEPPTPGLHPVDESSDLPPPQTASSATIEKLKSIGLKLILWYGTCEANQVSSGTYDVPTNDSGMYALVFDNTFAKSFSKTATFVLLTYPTDSAPQSKHQVHHFQGSATGSTTSIRAKSKSAPKYEQRESEESLHHITSSGDKSHHSSNSLPHRQENSESSNGSNFFTGILQKRRRKKHQGYARRFFSLDFTSSTLSYYHNRHTLALRGAVPLSLAAIGANATSREISIDSGAEVWHLRAPNQKEFDAWKRALESASRGPVGQAVNGNQQNGDVQPSRPVRRLSKEDEREWAKIEDLVGKVAVSRDIARRLAQDTDPKYLSLGTPGSSIGGSVDFSRLQDASSAEVSPTETPEGDEFFLNNERRPFWKRKASGGKPTTRLFTRSVSAQPVLQPPRSMINTTERGLSPGPKPFPLLGSFPEESIHEQCMSLLRDLDAVVQEFSTLLTENKQRIGTVPVSPVCRTSIDSVGSQEFFDAEGGEGSQLLIIQHETDDEVESRDQGFATDEHDVSSASEIEDEDDLDKSSIAGNAALSFFPSKPKSLIPLPLPQVKRRSTLSPPAVSPPSLIGFLRKNVGKDLSTISMPVASNEPISLLQRVSEQLEYSDLLDQAVNGSMSNVERLLYVTSFAISSLSAFRVKERAIRKPFNPMLGETFELLREDKGYRFIAEKVSHRPVQMACQAESEHWSLSQSPLPTQKFWGKSAELITEGRIRLTMHGTGDRFSWTQATCFLRNIIAGEKYLEPVGAITVKNDSTGEYAVITFKAKGMFSGRSEDVVVQTYDSFGDELPVGLVGRWTHSLYVTEHNVPRAQAIWSAGELVPDATKRYGFTTFTASLNEIIPRDEHKIAQTDSRFRPDQRAMENGDVDKAEMLKAKLEEVQRERRKVMDDAASEWHPAWFTKAEGLEGEESWKLKGGKDSYWEKREKGDWKGIVNVLAL